MANKWSSCKRRRGLTVIHTRGARTHKKMPLAKREDLPS